jgi:hypothetical protein
MGAEIATSSAAADVIHAHATDPPSGMTAVVKKTENMKVA